MRNLILITTASLFLLAISSCEQENNPRLYITPDFVLIPDSISADIDFFDIIYGYTLGGDCGNNPVSQALLIQDEPDKKAYKTYITGDSKKGAEICLTTILYKQNLITVRNFSDNFMIQFLNDNNQIIGENRVVVSDQYVSDYKLVFDFIERDDSIPLRLDSLMVVFHDQQDLERSRFADTIPYKPSNKTDIILNYPNSDSLYYTVFLVSQCGNAQSCFQQWDYSNYFFRYDFKRSRLIKKGISQVYKEYH